MPSQPVRLTDEQIRTFIIAFHRFDTDKDGFINRDELFNLLEDVNLFTTPDKLMVTLRDLEINSNKIDKTELLRLAKVLQSMKLASQQKGSGAINLSTKDLANKIGEWFKGGDDNQYSFFQRSMSRNLNKISAKPEDESVVLQIDNDDEESDYEYYSYSSESEEETPLINNLKQDLVKQEKTAVKTTLMDPENQTIPIKPKTDMSRKQTIYEKKNQIKQRAYTNRPGTAVEKAERYAKFEEKKKKPQQTALMDPKVRKQIAQIKYHRPYFLQLMTIIHLLVMGYEIYYNNGIEPITTNPFGGPSGLTLLQLGAKYTPCMKHNNSIAYDYYTKCNPSYPKTSPKADNGSCLYYDNLAFICGMGGFQQKDQPDQLFRFITPLFLHTGILHLLFDLIIQTRTGFQMESQIGSLRMAIVYIISGVVGNLFAAIMAPKQVTVGASGALYGLFALLYLDLFQNWPILANPRKNLAFLTISVVVALGVGFLPFIDNYAHIGGFISGIFSGLIVMPKISFGDWDGKKKLILQIAAVPILLLGLGIGFYSFYTSDESVCTWCSYLDCLPPDAYWCKTDQ